MNGFMKRLERVKAALKGRERELLTLYMRTAPSALWALWRPWKKSADGRMW